MKVQEDNNLNSTMETGINSLLRLMYKTCKNQKDRIQANLVQYKSILIMNKLFKKFKFAELKKNAAKVIKIQIKFNNKRWRM